MSNDISIFGPFNLAGALTCDITAMMIAYETIFGAGKH
jgi:hypothetical protein